jgi:glutaconate CoA-transferase, subunit B
MAEAVNEERNLIVAASLSLHDGETCFVGIGIPSLAAMVARHSHAPGLVLIYESGAVDADPAVPPLSTGSPSIADSAVMIGDCLDVFADLQAGRIDVGLLSAAQVDRFGNLNSTVIGDYRTPKLRLVGSGGAHDIASLAPRTIILMPHQPRRFVAFVDFVTSPGTIDWEGRPHPRREGTGPSELVTGRARFTFAGGVLTLAETFAPFTQAEALEGIPFDVEAAPDLREALDLPPEHLALAAKLAG